MKHKESAISQIPEALRDFDLLPNSAFVRLPTVQRLFGISSATVYRGVKRGSLPPPQKLSERCSAWNVGLLRTALASKKS